MGKGFTLKGPGARRNKMDLRWGNKKKQNKVGGRGGDSEWKFTNYRGKNGLYERWEGGRSGSGKKQSRGKSKQKGCEQVNHNDKLEDKGEGGGRGGGLVGQKN